MQTPQRFPRFGGVEPPAEEHAAVGRDDRGQAVGQAGQAAVAEIAVVIQSGEVDGKIERFVFF